MEFVGCGALNCVSMSDQDDKIRTAIMDINSNEPLFYPYSVLVQCSVKLRVSDVVKGMNTKVFNLISKSNEIRHVIWHENCALKSRLDASVCKNKQCWDSDKCSCECKELIDKDRCDDSFVRNLGMCECDKSYDVG